MILANTLQTEAARELFARYRVVLSYLFGSQAEGTARAQSDVDVAVLFSPLVPANEYLIRQLRLHYELCRLLGRSDVDLILLNEASPLLAYEVVRHGKLLFEDAAIRPAVDFAVYAFNRYVDTAPLRQLQNRYLVERITQRKRARTRRAVIPNDQFPVSRKGDVVCVFVKL